jgi:enamine deaminase RidA (YjgF/YER057c/UK114 family)
MPGDMIFSDPDTTADPGGHYSHAVAANGLIFVFSQLPIAFVTQA